MAASPRSPTFGLVVPCYDEVDRLRVDEIDVLLDDARIALVLVDDGSRDGTRELLRSIAGLHAGRVTVVELATNAGKGEAVRRGLLRAVDGAEWVGYVDADFATPAAEVRRLLDVATSRPGCDVVLGSRVALLGRRIERSGFRHYGGRVFATGASAVLGKPVYDTQCGAKLLRVTPALERAIGAPFHSRWAFDVELLGRITPRGSVGDGFWEEPLLDWRDAPDSHRSLTAAVRATTELWTIHRRLAEWDRR
jgi:dolichyl-phosphate beta-glucosyltransferase